MIIYSAWEPFISNCDDYLIIIGKKDKIIAIHLLYISSSPLLKNPSRAKTTSPFPHLHSEFQSAPNLFFPL